MSTWLQLLQITLIVTFSCHMRNSISVNFFNKKHTYKKKHTFLQIWAKVCLKPAALHKICTMSLCQATSLTHVCLDLLTCYYISINFIFFSPSINLSLSLSTFIMASGLRGNYEEFQTVVLETWDSPPTVILQINSCGLNWTHTLRSTKQLKVNTGENFCTHSRGQHVCMCTHTFIDTQTWTGAHRHAD